MQGDDESGPQDHLLAQQAAFFEAYFKKGAEFTRELMEETQRLRTRLAELEVRLSDQDRARELEARFEQIERENNDLAALYVAQSQLHSTLDSAEVLQIISEVLLNFVGADRFALLMHDGRRRLQPIIAVGVDSSELPSDLGEQPAIARLIEGGGFTGGTIGQRELAEAPLSSIALGAGESGLGIICIWGYLKQKQQVSELDRQIFDLITKSGAMALQAARIVGEARTRAKIAADDGYFERFTRLTSA